MGLVPTEIPWERMNRAILNCGEVHEEHSFGANAVQQLHDIVPYDQARVYFLDDGGRVRDQVLIGVERRVVEEYLDYYAKIENGCYDVAQRIRLHRTQSLPVLDWRSDPKPDQFQREYLRPQGIHYSTGMLLRDLYGSPRVLFCLDRTVNISFSHTEMETLSCFGAHLNNLYRNFYVVLDHANGASDDLKRLTPREREICRCLTQGTSPAAIAEKLCVSRPTVYKHIANIHEKLHVSNRQELLLRLLEAKI